MSTGTTSRCRAWISRPCCPRPPRPSRAASGSRAFSRRRTDMADLTRMTAAEIAAAVASGEASAVEVTRAHLDRIASVEPQVHAFLHLAPDQALAAAAAVDAQPAAGEPLGPLAGVPLALKDVFTPSDMPTTAGSRILEGWQPPYDATITRRLREAGVIVL